MKVQKHSLEDFYQPNILLQKRDSTPVVFLWNLLNFQNSFFIEHLWVTTFKRLCFRIHRIWQRFYHSIWELKIWTNKKAFEFSYFAVILRACKRDWTGWKSTELNESNKHSPRYYLKCESLFQISSCGYKCSFWCKCSLPLQYKSNSMWIFFGLRIQISIHEFQIALLHLSLSLKLTVNVNFNLSNI